METCGCQNTKFKSTRDKNSMNADTHVMSEPAEWVKKWDFLIPENATILDYACGAGRNSYYLLKSPKGINRKSVGIDINTTRLLETFSNLNENNIIDSGRFKVLTHDLTKGLPKEYINEQFSVVLWINYIDRTMFDKIIINNINRYGGLLIFQSYVVYPDGRSGGSVSKQFPMNPDHLLKPNEILMTLTNMKIKYPELNLEIISYETGISGSNDKLPRYAERVVIRLNGKNPNKNMTILDPVVLN